MNSIAKIVFFFFFFNRRIFIRAKDKGCRLDYEVSLENRDRESGSLKRTRISDGRRFRARSSFSHFSFALVFLFAFFPQRNIWPTRKEVLSCRSTDFKRFPCIRGPTVK